MDVPGVCQARVQVAGPVAKTLRAPSLSWVDSLDAKEP